MKVSELQALLSDKMPDDEVKVNVGFFIDYGDEYEEVNVDTDVCWVEGNQPVLITTGWVELEVKHSYKIRTDHAQPAEGKDYKRRNIEQMLLKHLAHMPWDEAMEYIAKEGGKK